jgi:hypothetical protein
MSWQVFRCRNNGSIWLWERPNRPGERRNVADNRRHLIPDENTRLALYSQYPVMVVPSEASLAAIPVGDPRGSWPYPATKNPLEADLFARGHDIY